MKIIVITGSTRGLGLGLAQAFLQLGHAVVVSGRAQETCQEAAQTLQTRYPRADLLARACDVSDPAQIQDLWDAACARFGHVDIWINNAGSTAPPMEIWKLPAGEARAVVETNILGVMVGSTTAARGMLEQGFGAIYNMEGMGSDGRKHAGLSYYGTTKYAIHYYTECLALEMKETSLIIGSLRPGMVATDMIIAPYKDRPEEWQRVRRIFNIIADSVENVTPWLARRILNNRKTGAILSYSSPLKLMGRFITSPFSKRELFTDEKIP